MAIFKGSGVAIATPFHQNDLSVDYEAFDKLIEYQIANHSDAIIVCGTTGEAATLNEEEYLSVCRFCVERVKGRVPVIAGAGSNNTAVAVAHSKMMQEIGADAVLIVNPYYNKGTQNGIYEHMKAVSDAIEIPIIMYNVPGRTGSNMVAETTARIVKEVKNVVGIKEASGNISQIVKIMELTDGNIDLYSGNDDQTVPILSMGGLGIISVVANAAPSLMHEMCEAFFAGDVKKAAALQCKSMPLFEAMFCEVNPIPVKKALQMMGLCDGSLRLPLTQLEEKNEERVRKALEGLSLL
ncbi:MAG: 4-hydroxy-tetrahydrodipicolinate synthase [Lachnospiraceae bacterium]|nr:4-hydroxy-tetrahydrodipicolinate synthase [Lachnospiraceae bacterium]